MVSLRCLTKLLSEYELFQIFECHVFVNKISHFDQDLCSNFSYITYFWFMEMASPLLTPARIENLVPDLISYTYLGFTYLVGKITYLVGKMEKRLTEKADRCWLHEKTDRKGRS